MSWVSDIKDYGEGMLGNFTGEANADAMREAAQIQADAYLESTRLSIEAAKEAQAAAIKYAETRREEDRVAAEKAAANAEKYIAAANRDIEAAMKAGVDTSNKEFQAAYDTIKNQLNPWIQTGTAANQQINALMSGSPQDVQAYLESTPGYAFRRDMGRQAVERSAAGKGNLASGETLVDLDRYGQGFASDEFNNAFNRLMTLSNQGLATSGTLAGYRDTLGQRKAGGAMTMANTRATNALNLGNTKAQGGWNVSDAVRGANAGVAQTGITGAWNVADVSRQGYQNNANALSNQAYTNMNADILENNFWPSMANKGSNAILAYATGNPMFLANGQGGGGGGGNQSFYVPY